MTIDIFEIDKSGQDILERDYSISVVKNNKYVYGYRISQKQRDILVNEFKSGLFKINGKSKHKNRLRFKIRFHASIIILLMKEAIKQRNFVDDCKILLCNDIDGHFHEIRDMVLKNLQEIMPTLNKTDIIQTKFAKDSLVNTSAKAFRERNLKEICKYTECKLSLDDLRRLIKKGGNQGQRP